MASNILGDNTTMVAAGGFKRDGPTASPSGLNDIFKMGGSQQYESRETRNTQDVRDINGSKRNQYGQQMYHPGDQYPTAQAAHYMLQPAAPTANKENQLLSPSMKARKAELLAQYEAQRA